MANPSADTTTASSAITLDRARGALLGLAVGDALGATLEFEPRDAHPHHTEMLGGGPYILAPGQWTDDTAMALALADSLLAAREQGAPGDFNPRDLAERFVAWWRKGEYSCTGSCFDIGMTTAAALARFEQTGDPYAGSSNPRDAGNGSVMRVAPVALFALDDAEAADRSARDQSLITHAAPQAVEACAFFVQLLRAAIQGQTDVLRPRDWAGDAAIRAIATGSWRSKPRSEIRSTGFVIDTLEAALWSIGSTDSFEDALVLAVNLGGDADTVGAVTGQLAGALYGACAIPERWFMPLAWRDRIAATADQLLSDRSSRHALEGASPGC